MSSIAAMCALAAAFGGLFLIAEAAHRYANIPSEVTRKGVHVGTGLLTMLFPLLLRSAVEVGILCGVFFAVLVASMRLRALPSINRIERKSWGSVLYPVIVFVVFLFYQHFGSAASRVFLPYYYFATPVLVMAFCDPLAAWVGSIYKHRQPEAVPGKTFAGSFAFFAGASVLVISLAVYFLRVDVPITAIVAFSTITAVTAALAERFSNGGWDNLTIPFSVMACQAIFDVGLKSFPA